MNAEMNMVLNWGNTSDSSYYLDESSNNFEFIDLTTMKNGGYGDFNDQANFTCDFNFD